MASKTSLGGLLLASPPPTDFGVTGHDPSPYSHDVHIVKGETDRVHNDLVAKIYILDENSIPKRHNVK